jgi:putative oxidoreductase
MHPMIKKLFETDSSFSGTILRAALGAAMFPHGAQKLLGLFGGAGFAASGIATAPGPIFS